MHPESIYGNNNKTPVFHISSILGVTGWGGLQCNPCWGMVMKCNPYEIE